MTDIKKRKIPITIILVIIILIYIISSIGILAALLDGPSSTWLIVMLTYLNYLGFGVIENITLFIIPTIIIFLINIKKIEIDRGVVISRLLSFICILINLLLFIFNLVYITWLNGQPDVGGAEMGIFAPILIFRLIYFGLYLVIYLLMTLKVD